jgi:hypothetical protein
LVIKENGVQAYRNAMDLNKRNYCDFKKANLNSVSKQLGIVVILQATQKQNVLQT